MPACSAGQLRFAFAVVLSLSGRSEAKGQAVVQLTIAEASLNDANALPSSCKVSVRTADLTGLTTAAMDSLGVRIVNASAEPVVSPVEFSVTVDAKEAVKVGKDAAYPSWYTTVAGGLKGKSAFITRGADKHTVCGLTIPELQPLGPADTVVKRLMRGDTLAIDSIRYRAVSGGQGFVILSLIKSVAGDIPRSEFFDLRMKFRSGSWGFTMANIDIALSQGSGDTLNRRLTEGGLTLHLAPHKDNCAVHRCLDGPDARKNREIRDREMALGGGYKIFNGVSYFQLGYGGYELMGSALEGSFATASWAHRLLANPTVPPDASEEVKAALRPRALDNLLIEFFIRVPRVQFLDRIRIRGGILLPFKGGFDPESRIVLSVPVVDLLRF